MLANINTLQSNPYEALKKSVHTFTETLLAVAGTAAAGLEQVHQVARELPRTAWLAMRKALFTLAIVGLVGCGPMTNTSAATIPAQIMTQHYDVTSGTVMIQAGAGNMGIGVVNGVPATATSLYQQGDQVWGEVKVTCPGRNPNHSEGTLLSFGAVDNFAQVALVSEGSTTYSFQSGAPGTANEHNTWTGPGVCKNLRTLAPQH